MLYLEISGDSMVEKLCTVFKMVHNWKTDSHESFGYVHPDKEMLNQLFLNLIVFK